MEKIWKHFLFQYRRYLMFSVWKIKTLKKNVNRPQLSIMQYSISLVENGKIFLKSFTLLPEVVYLCLSTAEPMN